MQSSYLRLNAKLSRSYLSTYLLIVILSIMSLWTMRQNIDSKIEETQFRMASSCHGLEIAATSLASTPHYVASQTNAAIASSISSVVNHMTKMLLMFIKLLNQLLVILLKRYQRLMVCILDSILAGSLGAIAQYSQEITTFIQAQMASISNSLNAGLDGINSQIKSINGGVQSAANTVTSLFSNSGNNVNIPTFSLPEVSGKLNFALPNDFQSTLQNLKNTVPDLEDAQNALSALISAPFNALSDSLNSTMKKVYFSELNLPVPAKAADATFCKDIPIGWIPKLSDGIRYGFTAMIWALVVLGTIIIIGNAYLIYLEHKWSERNQEKFKSFCNEYVGAVEPNDILNAVRNPVAFIIYRKVASKLRKHGSRMRLRWFLDYTIYNPSLLFLGIGILGLILINIQILILDRASLSALNSVNNELQGTTAIINGAVQKMVADTVDPYVLQANRRIQEIETQTNQILFGWINDTVQVVNQTTNTFTTGFNDLISKAFGAVPPLKDAISKFVYCMIGSSFESIVGIGESLKTSIHLEFPRVNSSVGAIDSEAMGDLSVLAKRMAIKMDKNPSNDGQSASGNRYIFQKEVDKIVKYYKSILETQRIAFYVCTGFGILGWIFGIVGALILKVVDPTQ